jgi:hypothetical protein
VRMRMVAMIRGEVPMAAVAGNLQPAGAVLEHTALTFVTTASRPTPDPGRTRKVRSPNEPGNGTIGKLDTLMSTVRHSSTGATGIGCVLEDGPRRPVRSFSLGAGDPNKNETTVAEVAVMRGVAMRAPENR